MCSRVCFVLRQGHPSLLHQFSSGTANLCSCFPLVLAFLSRDLLLFGNTRAGATVYAKQCTRTAATRLLRKPDKNSHVHIPKICYIHTPVTDHTHLSCRSCRYMETRIQSPQNAPGKALTFATKHERSSEIITHAHTRTLSFLLAVGRLAQ